MVPPFDWENWAGKTTHTKRGQQAGNAAWRGMAWRGEGCA